MINIQDSFPNGMADLEAIASEFADKILTGGKKPLPLRASIEQENSKKGLLKKKCGLLAYLLKDDNLRALIIAKPDELFQHIKQIEKKYACDLNTEEKRKNLFNVFGYERFRGNRNSQWLAEKLNIRACPYCGSQFTLYRKELPPKGQKTTNKIKLLFQLDHFFPKMKYPYLSLSFFNLVPSCASCNNSKSDSEEDLNLNPYHGFSLNELSVFKITTVDFLKNYIGYKQDYTYELQERKTLDNNSPEKKYLQSHMDAFNLNDLYQQHRDTVDELIAKSRYYDSNKKKELETLFNGKLTRPEIDRMIAGNYVEEKDFLKRPLAKFTKDIAQDLNLLDW